MNSKAPGHWRETDGHVYLTGPATYVYEGDIIL